jgi:Leucine-rich repeat (LRR) protein
MASIGRALLVCLAQLHTILYISSAQHAHGAGNLPHLTVPFLCHPDQAKLLLQLKKSFSFAESTTRLSSWRDGTDCCLWEGVGCDASSGNVTILDLNNRGLSSNGFDPAIFSLTSLRRLDLSMNDFSVDRFDDDIPLQDYFLGSTRFERFTLLTHLNLSCSGLYGQIPTGISKLVNLLSLDLSSDFTDDNEYIDYYEWESSFDITLVANLSNLRELYLDGVDLSSSGQEWGASLATSAPHLQVLSLPHCRLSGLIHESLSSLQSLVVINLKGNFDITAGPFPVFFMDFLNLTVLRLSNVNLEGWFPSRSFKSKNLKVLDLSNNQELSGHFPNLSNASSLETLRLDLTKFTYARPVSSSNFKSLKDLSLDGNFFSKEFLSLFGILGSLCQLELSLDSVSELGSIFSWIGDHKNLTSLTLSGCNFPGTMMPSFDGNFKALRSLTMFYCNLPMPVLHAVGNLMGLQALEMHDCTTNGSMPSSISNLTNLRDMYIDGGFSGHPMPAAIGKLTNLRNMYIYNCWFSGPMPSEIGNLTNLRNMDMDIHITHDGFSGPMPATIGRLTNLRNMLITNSGFSGPMPTAIGNLTNLKIMHISQNHWSSIPYTIGQLSELASLDLQYCNFSGSIPSSIVNLTQLTELDLSHNSLTGKNPLSHFIFLEQL